jgi:predicted dehydrogenase
VRVGIIGCGGIAELHAKGWAQTAGVEVVACSDIFAPAVEKFQAEHGIAAGYGDAHEMLAKESLDLVSICTWTASHAEFTVAACQAGVQGVICEKPVASSLAEADAMLAASEASGTKVAISFLHRFRTPNRTVRELVAAGAIGQPLLVTGGTTGGFANNHSHWIDRTRYWLGDPNGAWVMAAVERKTNRHERTAPIEDRAVGTVGFEGGCRYVFASDLPDTDGLDDSFLVGTEGALRVGLHDKQWVVWRSGDGGWELLPSEETANQFDELMAWLAGASGHRNALQTARGSLEIQLAVFESKRVRGLVTLPLENQGDPMRQLLDGKRFPLESTEYHDIRAPQR